MKPPIIVMLAGKGESTNILYHSLKRDFPIAAIILEDPVSKKEFIKKRFKKLGFFTVLGQVIFQYTVVKYLQFISQKRKKKIIADHRLDNMPLPYEKLVKVTSVNETSCIDNLQKMQPDIVIVNGTRIISKDVLNSVSGKFINIHAGITPKYRGVHGAYWALVNDDSKNCGVTVHLVDRGIDTGNVLYQCPIEMSIQDNFSTYPLLQLATGIPFMKRAIEDILHGRQKIKANVLESQLWSHPTIFQYLYYRVVKGKK